MPNSTVSSGKKTLLRGSASLYPSWRGILRCFILPQEVVCSGTINTTPTDKTFALLDVTVDSGLIGDAVVGQTLYISKTVNMEDYYFKKYVRFPCSGSNLYCGESSLNVEAGDSWWIVNDFTVHEKLARDTGEHRVDYDLAFQKLRPRITALKSVYVGSVNGALDTYSFAFDPGGVAEASGASVTGWLWDVGDGTITVGSTTTRAITCSFPVGWRWVYLMASDNNTVSIVRKILVIVEPRAGTANSFYNFESVKLNCEVGQGWSGDITVFGDTTDIFDNSLIVLWWDRENYSGTSGPLTAGDNIAFYGRLNKYSTKGSNDSESGNALEMSWDLEGIGTQLSKLGGVGLPFIRTDTPTIWQEMKDLTPRRAAWEYLCEYTTVGELCDVQFDLSSSNFLCDTFTAQGSNALGMLEDINQSINAVVEFDPDGTVFIGRMVSYMTDRSAVTTVIDYTNQDVIGVPTIDFDPRKNVGRVKGSGGSYSQTSLTSTANVSLAPGEAPDVGSTREDLTRQILVANQDNETAQAEINARTGNHFEFTNAGMTLTCVHPDGYGFLIPSLTRRYTFTLDATDGLRGIALTTAMYWQMRSISIGYDNETGERTVEAVYIEETAGEPGRTVDPQNEEQTPFTPADLNLNFVSPDTAFNLDFSVGQLYSTSGTSAAGIGATSKELVVPTKTGKTVIAFNTDGYIYKTTNWDKKNIAGGPTWTRASMGVSGTPVCVGVWPFSSRYMEGSGTVDAYVCTTTGLYKVTDCAGTPSASLQKTFRASSNRRSISISFAYNGYMVVVSAYTDGVYIVRSTDGTAWSTETLIDSSSVISGDTSFPGAFVSNRYQGRLYTSAYNSTTVAKGRKSTDNGATTSDATTGSPTIEPSGMLAGDIVVPYLSNSNEIILYHGSTIAVTNSLSRDFKFSVGVNTYLTNPPGTNIRYVVQPSGSPYSLYVSTGGVDGYGHIKSIGGAATGHNPPYVSEAPIIIKFPNPIKITRVTCQIKQAERGFVDFYVAGIDDLATDQYNSTYWSVQDQQLNFYSNGAWRAHDQTVTGLDGIVYCVILPRSGGDSIGGTNTYIDDLVVYYQNEETNDLIATFDSGGASYTILTNTNNPQASVVSGGVSGNCVSGGTTSNASCVAGVGNYSNANVKVVLPQVSTVTRTMFDVRVDGATTINWSIKYYNSSDVLITTHSQSSVAISDGVWTLKNNFMINVENVSYVIFNVNYCGTAGVTAKMDNCFIRYVSSTANTYKVLKVNGTTVTDISPQTDYTIRKHQTFSVSRKNPNYAIMAAEGPNDGGKIGIWETKNAWASRIQVVAPTNASRHYDRVIIASDGSNQCHFFGTEGAIGTAPFGFAPDDRRGNIKSTLTTSGSFIQIAGA